MGNRLHVAKKYDVLYESDVRYFNWQIDDFHDLLDTLEVSYTGDEWDKDFEVLRSDWLNAIEKLKSPTPEILDELTEMGITAEDCLQIFTEYLNASDQNNPYMWFSFF